LCISIYAQYKWRYAYVDSDKTIIYYREATSIEQEQWVSLVGPKTKPLFIRTIDKKGIPAFQLWEVDCSDNSVRGLIRNENKSKVQISREMLEKYKDNEGSLCQSLCGPSRA
jgi:hypothetical protein